MCLVKEVYHSLNTIYCLNFIIVCWNEIRAHTILRHQIYTPLFGVLINYIQHILRASWCTSPLHVILILTSFIQKYILLNLFESHHLDCCCQLFPNWQRIGLMIFCHFHDGGLSQNINLYIQYPVQYFPGFL